MPSTLPNLMDFLDTHTPIPNLPEPNNQIHQPQLDINQPQPVNQPEPDQQFESDQQPEPDQQYESDQQPEPETEPNVSQPAHNPPETRRSTRTRKLPSHLEDCHCSFLLNT